MNHSLLEALLDNLDDEKGGLTDLGKYYLLNLRYMTDFYFNLMWKVLKV